jgi:hypothetical protein
MSLGRKRGCNLRSQSMQNFQPLPQTTGTESCCPRIRRVELQGPPDTSSIIITALNFSRESVKEEVDFKKHKQLSEFKFPGKAILNCVTNAAEGEIDDDGRMRISLGPWTGKTYSIATGIRNSKDD